MRNSVLPVEADAQIFRLVGRQHLALRHRLSEDLLEILGPEGQTTLTIRITPSGPVLQFDGSVLIEATGSVGMSAERVAIHGSRGVAITTGGDVQLEAAGDIHSRARIQNLTAELGNVNVRANDDVRLNGERVMVNCDNP